AFVVLYTTAFGGLPGFSCDGAEMVGSRDFGVLFCRVAVVVRLVLAAILIAFRPAMGASPLTLQVETSDTLPGFHRGDVPRYLALHMAEAKLADWRFEPTKGDSAAPDRVEWSFRLNPYAGGEVHSFARPHMAERTFAAYRSVTIEVRLYLNGEYQTLVKKQA